MLKLVTVLGLVKKLVGFLARIIKRIATGIFNLIKKFFRRFWQEVKRAPLLFAVIGVLVMGIFGYAIHAHCEQSQKAEEEQSAEVTQYMVARELESIGELNTEKFTYTVDRDRSEYRKLFDCDVPLTENRLMISYNGVIKVGYKLEDIKHTTAGRIIFFDLPEPVIMDNYIDQEVVKLEQNNIFNPITSDDYASLRSGVTDAGVNMATEEKIYEKAEQGLKETLTNHFNNLGYIVVFKE